MTVNLKDDYTRGRATACTDIDEGWCITDLDESQLRCHLYACLHESTVAYSADFENGYVDAYFDAYGDALK